MLTADLAMSWQRGSRIEPRLIKPEDPRLRQQADELIALVRQHEGCRRQELEDALEEFVGSDPHYRLVRGWTKLLLDRCEFAVASAVEPARLREAIFRKAREFHPVRDDATRRKLHAAVAEELGCRPEDIPVGLYADLAHNQELIEFEEWTAEDLLHRYNLAQAQALLYRCQQMTITLRPQDAAGYRQLFDAVKAYRLIHTISGSAQGGYMVTLDGPISLFHRSQKYGIQMAVFLPALLLCSGWRMKAELAGRTGSIFYELTSDQKQLRSHYQAGGSAGRPDLEKLLVDWNKKERSATLQLCGEVIDGGGSAWAPDLVLRSGVQEPLYLELLGFWTPHSLTNRLKQIAQTGVPRYLLAVSNELRCSRDELASVPPQVLVYKTALDLGELEERALNQ
jgi:predicted nuclease of restriction endonuclease-like RecB superfamily